MWLIPLEAWEQAVEQMITDVKRRRRKADDHGD
jgi:hypothetical protein